MNAYSGAGKKLQLQLIWLLNAAEANGGYIWISNVTKWMEINHLSELFTTVSSTLTTHSSGAVLLHSNCGNCVEQMMKQSEKNQKSRQCKIGRNPWHMFCFVPLSRGNNLFSITV